MTTTLDKYNSAFLFNAILENCEDSIILKDLNMKYIACNKAFLRLLGVSSFSVISDKSIYEVLTPKNATIIAEYSQKVVDTGQTQSYKVNILNDKLNKILKIVSTPIIREGVVDAILSVVRDITHEENLKLKLIEKHNQMDCLLEHLPMPVYMKDKDLNYIVGTKYAKDFVDEGYDIYAGNIKIDMNAVHDLTLEEDTYVLEKKKLLVKEKKADSTDGAAHWYKIYKAPILDAVGETSGLVTIAQNIDGEKRIEIQKELFIATLTHDLKNALLAQIQSMQLLVQGYFGELTEAQKEILDITLESSVYMKHVLYSTLAAYKYENGNTVLNKEKFNVNDLVNTCVEEIGILIRGKNLELVFQSELSEADNILYADPIQLRRVISNLLNNVVNYAFSNTTLKICIHKNDNNIIFDFENSSPEISKDIHNHIFDKYVSGSDMLNQRGIGLGLYLARKIVEAHNGTIYHIGDGTDNKFTFEIPRD